MEDLLIEEDSITDLRILLNREIITRDKFYQIQNLLKVMPDLYELAQENE
jgi:hypothetical protein